MRDSACTGLTKDLSTWLVDAPCDTVIEALVAYLQQTKEQEEEDKAFAEFAANASPAVLDSLSCSVGETPVASSPNDGFGSFVAGSPALIPRPGSGFTPVQSEAVQAARDAQQTRLFAFSLQHGDAAPDLEAVGTAARSELSMDMSNLANMMGDMQLQSPAVSSPLELDEDDVDEEAQQLNELSELDEMLRETEEMEDVNEAMLMLPPAGAARSDRDGVAVQLEVEEEQEQAERAKEARAAALMARKGFAAVPPPAVTAPSIELPAVVDRVPQSPSVRTVGTVGAEEETPLAFADANLLETPYLQSRAFTQPDCETPGGTFLFASASPAPVLRDVTNLGTRTTDNCGTPVPSIGRPFEVDFESNLPSSLPSSAAKQSKQAAESEDELYLEDIRGRLKAALKCGVAELGVVIRTLKAAKPLQVELCIAPLYIKLRLHAKALHAARRGNVTIMAHKPALGDEATEMLLPAPFQASPLPSRD